MPRPLGGGASPDAPPAEPAELPQPGPDFFAAQAAARARARRWLLLFALCVAGVVAAMVGLAALASAWVTLAQAEREGALALTWRDALASTSTKLILASTVLVLLAIVAGYHARRRELARGADSFAASIGARRLAEKGLAPVERQLRNVADEMALASGSLPFALYVLDDERAINAITGVSAKEAFVVVTGGALEALQRDEMQALVGWGAGQVENGDAALNLRLVSWLAGITSISDAGRRLAKLPFHAATVGHRGGEGSDVRKGMIFLSLPLALAGVIVMAIGYVGVLFARVMRAFASRQRVLLADATAVQYTRDPVAVRDLLRRVDTAPGSGRLAGDYREAFGPMLFVPGVRRLCLRTHPPIARRIANLTRRDD